MYALLCAFFGLLGHHLQLRWVLEQPTSSVMHWLPYMRATLQTLGAHRSTAYLGHYGSESTKPLKLMGTTKWTEYLKTSKPTGMAKLVRRRKHKVTGIKSKLRASAAYPPMFGYVVAKLLQRDLLGQLPTASPSFFF